MADNDLVGTWELVSRETQSAGKTVADSWGRDHIGRLIFTGDGWVAAFPGKTNRAPFEGGDPYGGTNEELVSAAHLWMSYCGRYSNQDGVITLHVQMSFFPNWVGADLKRHVHLDGDTLTLSTEPVLLAGEHRVAKLVWKRLR